MNTTIKLNRNHLKRLAKKDNLYLNIKTSFSGMTDGVEPINSGFKPIERISDNMADYNLGINGVWSIKGRDLFEHYEDAIYTGISVYNSCGSFILAEKKSKVERYFKYYR
tara:strand:- start:187 stop:516 length:330 start_codon:yes stop_codon:yes gene_type:complete